MFALCQGFLDLVSFFSIFDIFSNQFCTNLGGRMVAPCRPFVDHSALARRAGFDRQPAGQPSAYPRRSSEMKGFDASKSEGLSGFLVDAINYNSM